MALTKSTVYRPATVLNSRPSVTKVTFDNSYVTGGFALAVADFGFNIVISAVTGIVIVAPSPNADEVGWNATTSKLQAFTSAGAEVAAAVDLSALVVQVTALGY